MPHGGLHMRYTRRDLGRLALATLPLASPPAAAQCSGPSFALPPHPGIGQSNAPWAAVTGDFFGPDGMLDVVATLDGSGQVVLLPGNNSGSLAPGVPVTAGVNPRDIVSADFNRDGLLDIAVATTGATSVSLLTGTGTGFDPATTEDLTWSPSRLATGDLDHDGWTDLVVVGEAAGKVRVLRGGLAFTHMADINLADASAVAVGDFDRNGWGDLAVTRRSINAVQMYMGSDDGGGVLLLTPGALVPVGNGPADIAADDVNYDGALDFVTANRGSGTATVRLGDGTGAFPAPNEEVVNSSVPPLVFPIRVTILDFDRDGGLDLALLDEGTSPPQVMVFAGAPGGGTPPPPPPSFDTSNPTVVALDPASAPKSLALGDVLKDGRPDLVVPESGLDTVVVVPNTGPPDCPRPSFYEAPRAYLAGDEPVWTAAADFVEDGIEDLVVASKDTLEVLRGTGNGFVGFSNVGIPAAALGIAAADFNFDGHADVVVALGNEVRLYRGDGGGGFPSFVSRSTGATASAVVVGDFNADGAPDAAVTSQGANQLHIFIGDGLGGLAEQAASPLATGTGPGALAAGDLDNNGTLDIVVANSYANDIWVYLGDIGGGGVADGTFTLGTMPIMGAGPWGVALAYFDGDAFLDVVTADHDASPTATVRTGNGSGGFNTSTAYVVEGVPISVAGLDATGDGTNDISVVTGDHTLAVLEGVGDGTFLAPDYFPVRPRPSAIVPVDADSDGRKDLAIPCKDADSVVVLLSRPPDFAEAVSIDLTAGASPTDIATADLDADGDLDLAVVNGVAGTVSILVYNQVTGKFEPGPTPTLTVGASPEAVVIADFDLDGILDLAVSCTGAGNVELFEGLGGGGFNSKGTVTVGVPDDLVAGDFNQDGAPDLAVCSQQSTPGNVTLLLNQGGFAFAAAPTKDVGDVPTAIVASDFDLDGALDVAVANDNSNTLTVLYGDGAGGFLLSTSTLALIGGDTSPVSVAAGDFDMDGDDDLATVAFGANMLSVFENKRALKFPDPPSRFDATLRPLFVGTGDVNRDGKVDLAIAAEGVRVQAGQGGLTFTSSEDLVAGLVPGALALGDFNRDGRPDIAVAYMASDNVSILFSTACLARRLVVATSPAGCGAVGPLGTWTVEAQDDAGNVSVCETGSVSAAIAPGTGAGGAILSGTTPQSAEDGVATFPDLSIDLPGAHYELEYTLSGLSPAISRSFSLGAAVTITGPDSICPSTSETYVADPGFDTYQWTIDGTPWGWLQSTQLSQPPLTAGTPYTLAVEARVDTCAPTDSKSVYVGDLNTVTISSGGPFVVCVDCLGGAFDVVDEGGGVASHLWGYRTQSGGTITSLLAETGDTYVLKGTDFPGPGSYYIVATTTPTCGSLAVSNEIMVDVTAAVAGGEAQSLGVTSRGNSTDGENILQWVNTTAPDQVLIRWNESTSGTSDCVAPLDRFAPYDGEFLDASPVPSVKGIYNHTGRLLDTAYCYSVFVEDSGMWSPGRTVKGRPFDATSSPVKWAYATGATAVVAPVVFEHGLLAISNDRTVHSLVRGRDTLGGLWPLAFTPATLPGVTHSRSPVVPFLAPVAGADALLYVGDDTGAITAIDADTGQVAWGPVTPTGSTSVRGAPGGVFMQYSGPRDLVLVGSISANPTVIPSDFYGLDIATGTATDFFNGSGTMGPVMTTPAVDYAGGFVYVTSQKLGGGDSVWSIRLSDFGIEWSQDAGDVVTSPVLKNGKVYVGNAAGEVYFLDTVAGGAMSAALDPPNDPTPLPPLDGKVKGFLFPDRRNDDLYFSTDSQVWSIQDTGSALQSNWVWTGGGSVEPGIVLHWPQTDYLYVGGKDGNLYQLDFSGGQPTDACLPAPLASTCLYIQLGDGQGRLGAPTLDIGLDPPDVSAGKEMLYIGSEAGVLFAVEVPF